MNSAVSIALAPLGTLYSVAMKTRRALYHSGRFHVHQLGAPVISVGNLTTGGTGKTPLVAWIARELARTGQRVCILTRGYGRRSAGARVVVSDGVEIISDAAQAGDEPLLLAETLKGLAAGIRDADRVSAARRAVAHLHSGVLVPGAWVPHLPPRPKLKIFNTYPTNSCGDAK